MKAVIFKKGANGIKSLYIGFGAICIMMILAITGIGTGISEVYGSSVKIYDIDKDTLPYTQEQIYKQLFDINNKVEMKLDMPDKELAKLQADYEKYSNKGSKSPIYRMADLTITITTATDKCAYFIGQVGVRMKGNTSRDDFYSSSKGIYNYVHLKFSFQETFSDETYYGSEAIDWSNNKDAKSARKDRLFATLEKIDIKWNRNYDNTYIREYYAYETFRANGVLAPHTNIMSMNFSGKNMGVYTFYEPVDKIFIEKYIPEADQGGDLYKCGWANGPADMTSAWSIGIEDEDANDGSGAFYQYDLKTNKKTSENSVLKNFINTINGGNLTKDKISQIVDIDSFMKFAAVSYFTGNYDDVRNNYNNYYIYFLGSSNKIVFIPYDLDRCFGVTCQRDGFDMSTVSPYSKTAMCTKSSQNNPLFKYTVTTSGYFINEYTDALQKVQSSKWLTTTNFNNYYSIAKSNYQNDAKVTVDMENATESNFYFSNNVTTNEKEVSIPFATYLSNIKKAFSDGKSDLETEAASPYYVRNDVNGWGISDYYKMKYSSTTKKYSYEISNTSARSLKVYSQDNDKWYGYDYIKGTVPSYVTKGDSDNIILASGKYTITFNPADTSITISKPKLEQTISTKVSSITKTYGAGSFNATDIGALAKGKISYQTSDSKVITYNSTTNKFKIVGAGTAKITIKAAATSIYNGATKTITVVINKKSPSISVIGTKINKVYGCTTFSLGAKTQSGSKLTYRTYNTKVAYTSYKGIVSVKGCGSSKIVISSAETANYKAATKTIVLVVKPKRQVISSISSTSGKVKVVYTKDAKATGYEIKYSTNSNFKNSKTVKVTSNLVYSKTISGLLKGKNYYVKVRAYKSGSTIYYGQFSDVKKIKIK